GGGCCLIWKKNSTIYTTNYYEYNIDSEIGLPAALPRECLGQGTLARTTSESGIGLDGLVRTAEERGKMSRRPPARRRRKSYFRKTAHCRRRSVCGIEGR